MGIAFITAKAEKFKHQRDAAYEEQLASENLFSKLPTSVSQTYRCKSQTDGLPNPGTKVLLYRSGDKIVVLLLNQEIGTVMSPDDNHIFDVMSKAKSEMFPAQVVDVRPLSKVFSVSLQSSLNI